jgi:nicotinamide-nucleotide amidase
MNAEIITIGTELLLGEIIDTNAAHIARQLRTIGLNLYYKTTVGDNEARCAAVIRQALARAEVVITTGGLGPTVDDVTREAVAQATDRPLELRPALLDQIASRFERWGSTMSENNRRQAYVPRDAIALENPVGTAPSFIVETAQGVVISLPGVPHEMKYLLEQAVLPYLRRQFDLHAVIQTRVLRTAGMGESRIDAALGDLLTGSNPTIGLAAHPGQTDVRITAKAESKAEADRLIAPLEVQVRERLGDAVYGTGKETVEAVLLQHLSASGWAMAVAESGTGGLLTQRLSSAPGAERLFRGGFVSNDPPALAQAMGVNADCISEEELEDLARRLATRLVAQTETEPSERRLGLVVLTFPHPSAEQATSAGGTVIALGTPTGLALHHLGFGGHAAHIARWASTQALEIARRWALSSGE